jgi:hypothetical protein
MKYDFTPDLNRDASDVLIRKVQVQRDRPKTISDDPTLDLQFHADFVVPRHTPGVWLQYMDVNTRLGSCVRQIARSSVGLGARAQVDPRLLKEFEGRPNKLAQLERQRQTLDDFIRRPNPNSFLPLSHEITKAEMDYQGCGNATLEILEENREAGGDVQGLLHVPFTFMRIDKYRERWIQGSLINLYDVETRSETAVRFNGLYYRVFGDVNPDHKYINRKTGEFYAQWPADLDPDLKGNAILHLKNYHPLDSYYGAPSYVSALNAIMGNDQMGQFMVSFLENGTHVPILVIVEGGNLTDGSTERIEAIFNAEGKGVHNANRAAIIEPRVQGALGQGAKIRIERVELGIKDLAGLSQRAMENNDEIAEAFRMSPAFLGGNATGTTRAAASQKHITMEGVINPRSEEWEQLLTEALAPRIAPGAVFKFNRPKNLDPVQISSVVSKMKDGLSVNDIRDQFNRIIDGADLPVLMIDAQTDANMQKPSRILAHEEATIGKAPAPAAEDPTNAVPLRPLPGGLTR